MLLSKIGTIHGWKRINKVGYKAELQVKVVVLKQDFPFAPFFSANQTKYQRDWTKILLKLGCAQPQMAAYVFCTRHLVF